MPQRWGAFATGQPTCTAMRYPLSTSGDVGPGHRSTLPWPSRTAGAARLRPAHVLENVTGRRRCPDDYRKTGCADGDVEETLARGPAAYIADDSIAAAAYELGISETTARQHPSGLYRRTGCPNAAQAAYWLGLGEWSVA